jgi:hypothetical protein
VQVPAEPALHCASALHVQAPAMQKRPLGHARPQAPQFDGSDCKSRQPRGVWQQVSPSPQAEPPLQEHRSDPASTALQASPGRQREAPHLQAPVVGSHEPVDAPMRQLTLSTQPH